MDAIGPGEQPETPLWKRIWQFPLVAMLVAIALFVAATALALLVGKLLEGMGQPERAIVRGAISIGLMLVTYKFAIARLGQNPRDDLPADGALRSLGIGLLAGLLIFSLVVGVAAVADVYNIVGKGDTSMLVLDLVGTAIMPAFMEELLFRGILFRWIEDFGGSWAALLITSALFGLAHIFNPNATWFSSFAIAMEAGLLLGGAYMLTRSLWMPMGLHAAWNFTQGFIFDVPVSGNDEHGIVEAQLSGQALFSGGGFGLEASIYALVIATVVGAWLVTLAVRRGTLVRPWWVRRRLAQAVAEEPAY